MISRAMEDIIMGYVLTLVPSFNISPSLLKLQNSEWDGLLWTWCVSLEIFTLVGEVGEL